MKLLQERGWSHSPDDDRFFNDSYAYQRGENIVAFPRNVNFVDFRRRLFEAVEEALEADGIYKQHLLEFFVTGKIDGEK